ncbi:MAG TPA: SGNH/GDSL hydrolase family protein [Myxococcaceae bacterium]|jgi:hypothetical protein
MGRSLLRVAAGLILALVALMLLGIGALSVQGRRPPGGNAQYVALGSSFSAGPGVGERAPESPILCMRSAGNYAHQLAAMRHLDLTDVTCSGSTTGHLLNGSQAFQPVSPLDALRPSTELVTVTTGGNDVQYIGNLYAWVCQDAPERMPWLWRQLGLCRSTPDADVERQFAALPGRLDRIAGEVHRRSPRATLVFADYTTVLPEEGACLDRLPLTGAQLARGRFIARRLSQLTAEAAQRSGAILVRVSDVTRAHDVCSAQPWVFGLTFPSSPLSFAPMALHPNADAMTAIARAIDAALPPARATP